MKIYFIFHKKKLLLHFNTNLKKLIMKRIFIILILAAFVGNSYAQNDAVLDKGHFLVSVGVGFPKDGIPGELSITYGTLDNLFGFQNLRFGVEFIGSLTFFSPNSNSNVVVGGGPNIYYTLFDHFDLFAGFNAGWSADQYIDKMGSTATPNYDASDFFHYFVNVGVRYSITDNFGIYARGNYSKISFGAAGLYLKW